MDLIRASRSKFGRDFDCSSLDDDVKGLEGAAPNDRRDAPGIPVNILSWLDQDAVDRLFSDTLALVRPLGLHPAARPNPNPSEPKRGSTSNLRR
jgi:hypothetical protein